jgi:thiol-disulfide isomerase/thioredoxin
MRKKVLVATFITMILFLSYLVTGIFSKIKSHKDATERIASLPSFSFLTLSNEKFNSTEITKGPVFILHFHPECEHCQWEIEEVFKSHIPDYFSHVLLISSANPDSIQKFLKQFNYSAYPSITALVDSSYDFDQIFGSSTVPSSYIYNKKLHLIKAFHGEVNTGNILNLISENE